MHPDPSPDKQQLHSVLSLMVLYGPYLRLILTRAPDQGSERDQARSKQESCSKRAPHLTGTASNWFWQPSHPGQGMGFSSVMTHLVPFSQGAAGSGIQGLKETMNSTLGSPLH